MNEVSLNSSSPSQRNSSRHPLDRQFHVHVTIPNLDQAIGEQLPMAMDEESVLAAPVSSTASNFQTLQDEYLFWRYSLLENFPKVERWISSDARKFERGLLFRLRHLVHALYHQNSSQKHLLDLELNWIWQELERRKLQTEALRLVAQTGVPQKKFLDDRQSYFLPVNNLWAPWKRLGTILLVFLAISWGVYCSYWLLNIPVVEEVLARLWTFTWSFMGAFLGTFGTLLRSLIR